MPTHYRPDKAPVVQFDPRIELSPFFLFRRLKAGQGPRLIDVRAEPSKHTLRGAERLESRDWRPEADEEIVLFDDDGKEALPLVLALHELGFDRVKMLFGGLELYDFSLSPDVVGEDTFLERG